MRIASGGGFPGGGDKRPPRDGRQSPQPVRRQQTPRRYARKRHFRYQTVGPGECEIFVVIVETGPADIIDETFRRNAAIAYKEMDSPHQAVNHSAGEYVRGQAHTNGIESFQATLKRAHKGTFHHFSVKHLNRYVNEFAGRHNVRNADTIDQMVNVIAGAIGKRLTYRALIA